MWSEAARFASRHVADRGRSLVKRGELYNAEFVRQSSLVDDVHRTSVAGLPDRAVVSSANVHGRAASSSLPNLDANGIRFIAAVGARDIGHVQELGILQGDQDVRHLGRRNRQVTPGQNV